jgi:hypothetical protein
VPVGVYREARTPASKGKTLEQIRISEGEDGGHLVEHHYAEDGMTFHKPKQYTFGADEGKDLLDHVRKHMHVKAAETDEPADVEREAEEA